MSVTEAHALDMTGILMQAYEVGEMINSSAEVANYIKWKNAVERDSEVQVAVAAFAKAKMLFEECERFGHFHPDYHAALDVVNKAGQKLDSFESVRRFKEAETRLDDLLFTVSKTIAHSVSDSIKVPSNDPLPTNGCGSGGCSGGCSSCG